MSNLVVIGFDNELQAEELRLKLLKLQREYLIDLEDAVVAVRKPDGKVKLNQAVNLTAAGAASGGFWGILIGSIFLSPLFGLAVGATAGAISGALSDIGIDDNFMKELASTMKPGSSALFVLVRKATPDKVLEEVQGSGGKVLKTSLTHEKEAKLQAALDAAKKEATTSGIPRAASSLGCCFGLAGLAVRQTQPTPATCSTSKFPLEGATRNTLPTSSRCR
ncbi:MAG: DUF1269 domain-containing protein [Thermoguttaceae bacterium]|jgi:uncharacterized membrane protein